MYMCVVYTCTYTSFDVKILYHISQNIGGSYIRLFGGFYIVAYLTDDTASLMIDSHFKESTIGKINSLPIFCLIRVVTMVTVTMVIVTMVTVN